MSPIGAALRRTGLAPDHLTGLGLVMALPAAVAIGSGRLLLGLILLIASSIPDLLDGALAKASGTSSLRGAFFDSVADRVSDGLILGGVGWYLQSTRHGHAFLLPFAILAASTLISYERAKAESLGFDAKGGLMERAERIIVLCVGLVAPVILVPLLWTMLVLTLATAAQRFVKVWRQAGQIPDLHPGEVDHKRVSVGDDQAMSPVVAGHAVPAEAPVPVSERWRAWRDNGRTTTAARPERFAHGSRRGRSEWTSRPERSRRPGSRRP